jgi:hypothetical protein
MHRDPENVSFNYADAEAVAARRYYGVGLGAVGQGARSELSSILEGLATFSVGEWPDVGRATNRWEKATGAFLLSIDWRRGLLGLWIAVSFVWLVSAGALLQEEIRRDVSTLMSAELRLDTDPARLAQLNALGPGSNGMIYQFESIYQFEPEYAARAAAQGNLIHAASVLFLPPLLVFAIGCAGLWTWRGIRS